MKNLLLVICIFSLILCNCYGKNETFVIKELNLELTKYLASSFIIGSPLNEPGRFHNEKPHFETITKDPTKSRNCKC